MSDDENTGGFEYAIKGTELFVHLFFLFVCIIILITAASFFFIYHDKLDDSPTYQADKNYYDAIYYATLGLFVTAIIIFVSYIVIIIT